MKRYHFQVAFPYQLRYATPVKDDLVLNRFPVTAKNKILQIDLKKSGIKDFGTLTPRGFARPYQPAPMELFCNKGAMHLARYPNDTFNSIGKSFGCRFNTTQWRFFSSRWKISFFN